jgi:glycogen phosphorylase
MIPLFLFGLPVQQVSELRSRRRRPHDYYVQNSMFRDILDLIASAADSASDKTLFGPIVDNLLGMTPIPCSRITNPVVCRDQVSALWSNRQARTCKSIANVPRMGKFSSDRS